MPERYVTPIETDLNLNNNYILGLVPESVTALPTENLKVGRLVVYSGSMYMCVNPDGATTDDIWRVFSASTSTAEGLTTADINVKVAGLTEGKIADSQIPNIAISKVTGLQTALDGKVTAVAGSRLMTDAEGTKLEGIEAGAQVNKIDAINFKGAPLTITDKEVELPTDLFKFNNDNSQFITKAVSDLANYYTKDEVTAKIAEIKQFNITLVDALPENGVEGTIYLVPHTGGTSPNIKDEYIWITGVGWEIIGTTEFKLNIDQGDGKGITINNTALQDATDSQDGLMTKEQVATLAGKADTTTVTADLAKKVDKVEGSRLMTNDEGTKLEGITTGAQVNVIESVKVGTTALEVTGKAVTIPTTDAVAADNTSLVTSHGVHEAITGLQTGIETDLEGKVDKLTTKPDAGTYTKVQINGEGQVVKGVATQLTKSDISDFPTLFTRYTATISGNGTTKEFSVPADTLSEISSISVFNSSGVQVITGVALDDANKKVKIGFNTAPATGTNYTVVILAKPSTSA
mgnify:CR=1 FL=1